MEGVGARLGRSSSRYGPTTVFTGPVRKWKKRWVPFSPSSNNTNNHTNHNNSNSLINGGTAANGPGNGGGLHLVLFKWTPLADKNSSIKQDSVVVDATEDRPKRKFKCIPIAVIEEQIKEDLDDVEIGDEETLPTDTDPNAGPSLRTSDFDEKPDINNVPMEENQMGNQVVRQDLNESLDLSLG